MTVVGDEIIGPIVFPVIMNEISGEVGLTQAVACWYIFPHDWAFLCHRLPTNMIAIRAEMFENIITVAPLILA